MNYRLCIDVGYTHTRFGLWDGQSFRAVSQRPTFSPRMRLAELGMARRATWLTELAEDVGQWSRTHELTTVHLCIPGIVTASQRIGASCSLWGVAPNDWSLTELEQVFQLPTRVMNDLTAAAIRYGRAPRFAGCGQVLVVSVSSGIGAKLYNVKDGVVILEPGGRNGEIGLTVVDETASALTNSRGRLSGILGNYASGSGFVNLLRARAAQDPAGYVSSALRSALGDQTLAQLDFHELNGHAVAAIGARDKFCCTVLAESVHMLARVLQTVILFTAPGAVVVTGGFADSLGPYYVELLRNALQPYFKLLYGNPGELAQLIQGGARDGMDNLLGLADASGADCAYA